MASWLRAKVNRGQFPGEFTVVTSTSDGQVISMFAPGEVVDPAKHLVRVQVLESAGDAALVYLPVKPFEGPSQTIRVPMRELINS
jgi:hypothetical protein